MQKKLPADEQGFGLRKEKCCQAPADKMRDKREEIDFAKAPKGECKIDDICPMKGPDHCTSCEDPTKTFQGKGKCCNGPDSMTRKE